MSWILLSSGRGPGECQLAVKGLTQVLISEAQALGIQAELISVEEGEHGPLSSLVSVKGDDILPFAQSWAGSIKWVCQSPIRRGWPRKNWFISVSLLQEPEPSVDLDPRDVRLDAFRASGPGGQHVNKTETAVRATHLPTGIAATAQEERSQYRNKALAMSRLAAALEGRQKSARSKAEQDRWTKHDALERGNAVRTYCGENFKLGTCHTINQTRR